MPAKTNPLTRLRQVIRTFPEATEVEAWGAPTWRVGRMFAMFEESMHGLERVAIWIKAAPGNNEIMVATDPKRFFIPPYVGPAGWVGVRLDRKIDWDELADLLRDGYRLVAPKRLLKGQAKAHSPEPRAQSPEPRAQSPKPRAQRQGTKPKVRRG